MVDVCQVRPSSSTKADPVLEALIQRMNTRWHHRRPVIPTLNGPHRLNLNSERKIVYYNNVNLCMMLVK